MFLTRVRNISTLLLTSSSEAAAIDTGIRETALNHVIAALQKLSSRDESTRKHKEENDSLRILCFEGMSTFSMITLSDDARQHFAPVVISAFVDSIGETFKSKVNHCAIAGLSNLLLSTSAVSKCDVDRVMATLISKLRRFIVCDRTDESVAAINCFAIISRFATDAFRDVYVDNAHGLLVALVLHSNNDCGEVKEAAGQALQEVFRLLGLNLTSLSSTVQFDLTTFLKELARCETLAAMIPSYISTAVTYLQSSDPQTRINAIIIITELIACCPEDEAFLRELNADSVYKGLTSLVVSEQVISNSICPLC